MTTKPFIIVKEPLYDKQIAKIAGSFDRMNALECAIDWALARKPHPFTNFFGDYYVWQFDDMTPVLPAVAIVYKLSEELEKVTLLSIEEVSRVGSLIEVIS